MAAASPARAAIRARSSRQSTPPLALGAESVDADDEGALVAGRRGGADRDREAITNPTIIVEVLSESIERDDRGWKFRDYRTLPSLDEYALVSQTSRRIEEFRRATSWQPEVFESGTFTLHGATISISAIYDE